VSRDPADGENRRSPQVGDELVDGGDERSVGFGLPLADADVEGVLIYLYKTPKWTLIYNYKD